MPNGGVKQLADSDSPHREPHRKVLWRVGWELQLDSQLHGITKFVLPSCNFRGGRSLDGHGGTLQEGSSSRLGRAWRLISVAGRERWFQDIAWMDADALMRSNRHMKARSNTTDGGYAQTFTNPVSNSPCWARDRFLSFWAKRLRYWHNRESWALARSVPLFPMHPLGWCR